MTRTIASPLKFLPLVAGLLVSILATYQLHAQCPVPPTTHPNGVIEGPVSCIGDQGGNSTVAYGTRQVQDSRNRMTGWLVV